MGIIRTICSISCLAVEVKKKWDCSSSEREIENRVIKWLFHVSKIEVRFALALPWRAPPGRHPPPAFHHTASLVHWKLYFSQILDYNLARRPTTVDTFDRLLTLRAPEVARLTPRSPPHNHPATLSGRIPKTGERRPTTRLKFCEMQSRINLFCADLHALAVLGGKARECNKT